MAQRYGRRRKRAHLAKIAELTESHQREVSLSIHLGSEVRRMRRELEDWDEEITRLLGEYSAFRRATPIVETTEPMREVPIRPRLRDALLRSVAAGEFLEMEQITRERMYRFIVLCEKDEMRMRRIIRLVEHDGLAGEFAYSISESMFRYGFGPREEEYLARKITHSFVVEFNKKRAESKDVHVRLVNEGRTQ
jgi:hypothetical protein